jgi:hypothetical protein
MNVAAMLLLMQLQPACRKPDMADAADSGFVNFLGKGNNIEALLHSAPYIMSISSDC